jgi:tight adherence protein B
VKALQKLLNDPVLVKWLGYGLVVAGLFFATLLIISDPEGAPRRAYTRYVIMLERDLRSLFIWTPGDHIFLAQFGTLFLVLASYLLWDLPYWYVWAGIVVIGPYAYIKYLKKKRVEKIEEMLDGFMLALANALKATPSITDAFISTQKLLMNPMKQEVELAVKEMRLGSTLDQALLSMAGRIGSRQVDSALAAVLIGRQVGGNLPKILETTASSLREMARLEGVVRIKTAEGRAQLWMLAFFPLILIYLLSKVKLGYFDPLLDSFLGYMIITIASVLWLVSILWARKILNVDI